MSLINVSIIRLFHARICFCEFLDIFDKCINLTGSSRYIFQVLCLLLRITGDSFCLKLVGFCILISGNIARRLGLLGHFFPEIWRESLYYLVIFTFIYVIYVYIKKFFSAQSMYWYKLFISNIEQKVRNKVLGITLSYNAVYWNWSAQYKMNTFSFVEKKLIMFWKSNAK